MSDKPRAFCEFREVPLRSWFQAISSRILCYELSERLRERFSDCRGLFITLTYDQSKYESPLDLYRAQSDRRHVRRFIERLSAYLGEDLRGKWLRKMEFQNAENGAWLHFHMIVETNQRIPNHELRALWGHGFVNVQRLTPERCNYVAKYVAKGTDCPSYLLYERPRSVKIVSCSPGFWPDLKLSIGEAVKRPPAPCYVPLGQRLADGRAYCNVKDSSGYFSVVHVAERELFTRLVLGGAEFGESRGSWHRVYVPAVALQLLQGADRRATPAATLSGGGASRAKPGLNLNTDSNPPNSLGVDAWSIPFWSGVGVLEWEIVSAA